MIIKSYIELVYRTATVRHLLRKILVVKEILEASLYELVGHKPSTYALVIFED